MLSRNFKVSDQVILRRHTILITGSVCTLVGVSPSATGPHPTNAPVSSRREGWDEELEGRTHMTFRSFS